MKRPSGFTLVELVMIIVIISVLASISLPKFVNLQSKAKDKADAYVIEQLRAAILSKLFENVANGVAPNVAAPTPADLFSLLATPPPYQLVTEFAQNTQDNLHWRIFSSAPNYNIYCPHYNGGIWVGTGLPNPMGSIGKRWDYNTTAYGDEAFLEDIWPALHH